MKRLLTAKRLLTGLALGLGIASPAVADPLAGYDRFTVVAAHRAAPVAASLWYPAGTPTNRGLVGDNPVFKGTYALVGATIAEGRHPLVVLSHGSGGNMDGLSWLSSGLALRGAMVLAVNHPGSTSGDSSPRRSIRLDERAADLRAAFDTLLSDPAFAPFIDPTRITSFGFSLGGTTALNLAGIRMDRGLYGRYCRERADQADCRFFTKGGVNIDSLPAAIEADMRDPRIGAAVVVDPGMTYGFTDRSIMAATLPVLVINLGGAERWKAADVTASGSNLVPRLPDVRYEAIAPANYFTFLAECKPAGRALLAEERDDPVCDDPEGTDRALVHARILDRWARSSTCEPGREGTQPSGRLTFPRPSGWMAV
jgi:predicted dienelactone hydrolase